MNTDVLKSIASAMVAKGKGILAADESHGTCKKRFDALGIECDEESRRQYRQMLITAPGVEEFLGGIILFDETIRQFADDGSRFVDVLNEKGIIPGIKVDTGAKDLALHPGEKVTEGLDGLRERLAEYRSIGARFAKWRAVITIDAEKKLPTDACLWANAHALARYAALCQEAEIVPIVEPEVLMDGFHSLETCEEVTGRTLEIVFQDLNHQGVYLPGIVLKPSMVLSGANCPDQADIETVAQATVRTLKKYVPADVPGCAFLSGGQSAEVATAHLNAMNTMEDVPWNLTFSYGRAIQQPALKKWAEAPDANVALAQAILLDRCRANGLATRGEAGE